MKSLTMSQKLKALISSAVALAEEMDHQVLTLDHVFLALGKSKRFSALLEEKKINVEDFISLLEEKVEKTPASTSSRIMEGAGVRECMVLAADSAVSAGSEEITVPLFLMALEKTKFSSAGYNYLSSELDYEELVKEYAEIIEENPSNSVEEEQIKNLITNVSEFVKENPEPFVGRDKEIAKTIQILHRKKKNNVLHVGEPGVGKTALLYGLAAFINEKEVPEKIKNNTVYSLSVGTMVAGTQYRGDFEKRMKTVLDFLKEKGNCILYIDEIHTLFGSGASTGNALDGVNLLKPYLLDGSIKFIGATTFDEYKKFVEKDKAFSRRFQIVEINEPSIEDCITILQGSKKSFEDFHSVKYSNDAIEAAVRLSVKYIKEKFLPDKAIDLIDEAGANINASKSKVRLVDKAMIENIVAINAKVPVETIDRTESDKLKTLSSDIKKKVFGQDEAIDKVTEAIMLSRAGLGDPDKPIASYLFVGPTGVGKTEIAKQLAENLNIELIRFDMSEYMEEHSVAKLIGAPAGYVGYEDGGLLVEKVRNNPHCVLLFDEIEKAHPKVYNAFLQVLDYGTLTDSQGRKADFRNAVIIFTSNCGAHSATKKSIGFTEDVSVKTNTSAISESVNNTFSPEFRNRLSGIITFNALSHEMAEKIVDKYLNELSVLLKEKNCSFKITEEARNYIIKEGITDVYGARELIRVIAKKVKPLFVTELLFGKLSNGGSATIDFSDDKGLFLSHLRSRSPKTPKVKEKV